jgi:hypothetical protein
MEMIMVYPNPHKEEKREIDVDQVVTFLTNAFDNATRSLGHKNTRGTKLYDLQCEFTWLIHEITNGPYYIVPKHIQTVKELISEIPPN